MKENCFVHFTVEVEDGSHYGIYNSKDNLIVCACCGDFYSLDGITILETMEIGLEAYDAIGDAFAEDKFWKRLRKREAEIRKGLDES